MNGQWTVNMMDGALVVTLYSAAGRKIHMSVSKEQIDELLNGVEEMVNDDSKLVC